jgi:methionyl-tRNA formyltransferase
MTARTIVIATPHTRNDQLEADVRAQLRGTRVVRLRERAELTADALAALQPRWIFFPHWSWMIPPEIFTGCECVIFHMTDLPYGRGGSPLQNLIVRGKTETVVSALRCEAELDAGPVYLRRPLSLEGSAEEILRRASDIIAQMIVEIVEREPTPMPQAGEAVVFKRRTPADGDLLHANGLQQVYDFIRMLDADGYPHAFIDVHGLRLTFDHAVLKEGAVEARVHITTRPNE